MPTDPRNLLSVLKDELAFLERGGYRDPARAWGPQLIFEDSPTCLNYRAPERPYPCSDCILMNFVPEDRREEKFPCRFIPLNKQGETIDSLYRTATQATTESAVSTWLQGMILKLEFEGAQTKPSNPKQ